MARHLLNALDDLNKDVLKGGDVIRPNMKLRLPAKPLASAAIASRPCELRKSGSSHAPVAAS